MMGGWLRCSRAGRLHRIRGWGFPYPPTISNIINRICDRSREKFVPSLAEVQEVSVEKLPVYVAVCPWRELFFWGQVEKPLRVMALTEVAEVGVDFLLAVATGGETFVTW